MTITITHPFQSAKADGVDLTLVQPSNWNEAHVINMAGSGKFIGRTAVGTGPATELNLSDFAVPTGAYAAYAGDAPAPTGWALCDGHAENRTTQAALFAKIGTKYGVGDGSTTFNVPDLRGRGLWGADNMGGSSANVLTFANSTTIGFKFGVETHTHTFAQVGAVGTGSTVASVTGNPSGLSISADLGGQSVAAFPHTHDIPSLTVNVTTNVSGTTSSALSSGMNPGMIVNWIIKL